METTTTNEYTRLMSKREALHGAAHRVYFFDPTMALIYLAKASELEDKALSLSIEQGERKMLSEVLSK